MSIHTPTEEAQQPVFDTTTFLRIGTRFARRAPDDVATLGRASRNMANRADMKARDERKDTLILLVGAVSVLGFVAVSLQWNAVALGMVLAFGVGIVRTVLG
jgi:hypothetical protein